MTSRTRSILVACLLIGACECDDVAGPLNRTAQPNAALPDESARPNLPRPEGAPVEPETLAKFAPDAVAGFTPEGPAEPKRSPLPNGGTLASIRRHYRREQQKLQLELTDSLHAPAIRQLVIGQQGRQHKAENSAVEGAPIDGRPALVQWHGATQTAIVNLVAGDRFLVNVKITGAESNAVALEVVKALPVADIAALATKPEGSTAPDETAEDETAAP